MISHGVAALMTLATDPAPRTIATMKGSGTTMGSAQSAGRAHRARGSASSAAFDARPHSAASSGKLTETVGAKSGGLVSTNAR